MTNQTLEPIYKNK